MHGEMAVLADGNSFERFGLSAILRQDGLGYEVRETERYTNLEHLLSQRVPHMLVIDSALEGLDGLDDIDRLCATYPGMKVCVAVTGLTRAMVADYISVGVLGCIEKTQSTDEVYRVFKTISDGGIFFPNPFHARDNERRERSGSGSDSDAAAPLTPRQCSVPEIMAQGKSNKEIARTLGIREGTVKVHLAAAYRSLGVQNRVAAVHAYEKSSRAEPQAESFGPMLPMPGLGGGRKEPAFVERRRAG